MKKTTFFLIVFICLAITTPAQTLFTYGKYQADAKDFLRAYRKNNTQPVSNKAKAIHDYLDLYINSRLKIREAYERGYDTLSQLRTEVDNLRSQIIENYMNDPETVNRLLKEAFQRSQKDIHAAHIFISFKNSKGETDTVAAKMKLNEILKRLEKNDDFLNIAQQNSDDPSARINKGDMGFITVFTLPYVFENVIYSTLPGKYSKPYRSAIGYHIFKNLGERRAVGKIKAQQILLIIPPGADEITTRQISKLADSLYNRIIAGDDFSKLAVQYSNDYISAASKGNMQDISVGQYDPSFENVLWSLTKDGAVSKPFLTSHGYHIVKRIGIKPIITDFGNKSNQQELQQRISADSRWKASRNFIYNSVQKKRLFKKYAYNDAALWAFTDSLLANKQPHHGNTINNQTAIFKLADSTNYVADFVTSVRTYGLSPSGTRTRSYESLMEEYVHERMYNYYRDHLEDFNETFNNQMTEFRDGNLFFEIMQREIWNKAQSDSIALLSLYEKKKKNYNWKPSADVVIFFCSDEAIAKTVFEEVKKSPAEWRTIADKYNEKVAADSSRYEWDQIPNMNKKIPVAGIITAPLINKTDNTASFAYIVKVYPQSMQRSFNEAKGLVINDYQTVLEDQWIKELKKKYPVSIDQKVLAGISK